ncbi:ABC transporter family substrate-binding protein [Agrococcus sp. ARC_14]|uniref:ABC transporter family substrate-binding protein n=1 Tax=Agrococcus sp. ARC_14 TaxID=2919927 RepID=UPI001F051F2D|nr:ABC transporter family substrate-binding protein [Agrococcus sp. ARC_14]MCH1882590.1 ABC transporter family substrate-binding protein [Agrococcus sp. ARC_14]
MMRRRGRAIAGIAIGAAAMVALAGCTTGGTPAPSDSGTGEAGGTISVAQTNAVTALTSATPDTNLNTNGMVDFLTGNATGPGSMLYLDEEFNIVPDETNATIELISEEPLVVQYTLDPEAVWSDGTAMSMTDLLLQWAIGSGWFDDATIDEATGEVTGGNQYFQLAGSTAGLDTTEFPEIDEEARTLTLNYGEPYVDWNLVNLIGKPAHVFAEQAGFESVEALHTFLEETPAGDPENPIEPNEQLSALAEFWNTGYNITAMPEDESLLVSAGMWVVKDFQADDGGFISFERNPEWRGEQAPSFDELILRFIGDPNAQITALQNGEVDVIEPQPSADTVSAIEAFDGTLIQGPQLSYDHLDLTFNETFADPAVREAFLLTIPRQAILEAVVTPVDPEAEVLNSQQFVANQPQYADAIAANGYSDYAEPDIARATELLAGATPTVSILYNTANPNRVDAFQLIQASAAEAGFIVEDAGSPDWSTLLGSGSYDASIFGWISPGAGYASLPQIWQTGGGGNYNNYSNAEVDTLADESQVTIGDEERLTEIQVEIDRLSREDFYGLPLFQVPGLVATNGTVDGVVYNGGQTGAIWNTWEWSLVG